MGLLEVRNIKYAYDDKHVLNDINFCIERGEIVGLLGPNGAGKSTLFRLLTGLKPITSGEIVFDKNRVGRASRAINENMRSRIGVVFQSNSLDTRLTARANLRLSGELYGLSRDVADEEIENGIDALCVRDTLDVVVKNLSGGTQRKIELIRALLHKPELVMLDEPSAGFDVVGFRLFWDYIFELRKGFGLSALIATHRPEEGLKCDRLLVLNQGRVVAFETPAQLLSRVRHDIVTVQWVQNNDSEEREQLVEKVGRVLNLNLVHKDNQRIRFQCEDGGFMIPRIIEAFPCGSVESVQLKKPALDDVFLALTGARLLNDGTYT